MKKLGKKITFQNETVEAYYCDTCNQYCSCTCGCPPGVPAIYSANQSNTLNVNVSGSNPRIAIAH